jgi:hypothetical protein
MFEHPILCVLHIRWDRGGTESEGTSRGVTDRQLWVNDGSFHHVGLRELSPHWGSLGDFTKGG